MDYKEKYEDALERARVFKNQHPTRSESNLIDAIFPELAEKLIAEIERRKCEWRAFLDRNNAVNSDVVKNAIYEDEGILDFITSLQQEQPKVELEEEINKFFDNVGMPVYWCNDVEQREFCSNLARHFWNKGHNARKEE